MHNGGLYTFMHTLSKIGKEYLYRVRFKTEKLKVLSHNTSWRLSQDSRCFVMAEDGAFEDRGRLSLP